MFNIIKPQDAIPHPSYDPELVNNTIIEGLKNDSIMSLKDAIEVVGLVSPTSTEKLTKAAFNLLYKELLNFNIAADEIARNYSTEIEIRAELDKIDYHFSTDDMLTFKIEMYGSIEAWVSTITNKPNKVVVPVDGKIII